MNLSTAIFLINNKVRAIHAIYEAIDEPAQRHGNPPKVTMFKTLDQTIKVDDFIVVPTDTRHKMTVVKVTETDVDVDFESSANVHWIIGRVDRRPYEDLLVREGETVKAIQSATRRKKRDDLRETMLADHVQDLKLLPMASMNGEGPAVEPPAVSRPLGPTDDDNPF